MQGEKSENILYKGLIAILFISGFSALLYQVIWIRHINLIFGVHVYSTCTVIASFMAGISLGSYLLGKYIDRSKSPLTVFLIIEALIGIYGLIFPYIIKLLNNSILSLNLLNDTSTLVLYLVKFLSSFIILLIPTLLMGGTLPIASKIVINQLSGVGRRVGMLYGSNNLGAVTGILTGIFILLRSIGLRNSEYIAVSGNILNVIMLLAFSFIITSKPLKNHPSPENKDTPEPSGIVTIPGPIMAFLMIGIFMEGFTTLGYEIVWTRLFLEFSNEKTVYAYSIIILGFVAGLSLGGFLYSRTKNYKINQIKVFGMVEAWIAVTAALSFYLFIQFSPGLVAGQSDYATRSELIFKEYIFILSLIIIPSVLMGYTFPLVSSIIVQNIKQIGSRIGVLAFLDNFGAIFGALIIGFILIPLTGLYRSFNVLIVVNLVIGIILILLSKSKTMSYFSTILAPFLLILIYFVLLQPGDYIRAKLNYYPEDKIVAYKEGVEATVTVHIQPAGHKALAINGGKTAYANSEDIRVHKMLAYLPWLMNPESKSAFVIGFGMGVTAKSLTETDLQQIDIAEISPGVIQLSSEHFTSLNEQVFMDERVNIILEDGRSYLTRYPGKFDLITTNAVHARIGANLYTRDFYQLCARKLNEGGTVCQWLPTNWLTESEYKSLIKAFIEVFPYASLWYATRSHTLIVGSQDSKNIGFTGMIQNYNSSPAVNSMVDGDIYDATLFLGCMLMDSNELKQYSSGSPENTDNNPVVEYSKHIDMKPNLHITESLSSSKSDFESVFSPFILYDHKDSLNYDRVRHHSEFYKYELKRFIEMMGSE